MIDVGAPIPDLSLPDAGGHPLRLRELVGEKILVIYFYPKDDTPGCTAQACGFRDAYEDFVEAGAEVIGISQDTGASHAAFAAKHGLPFRLLSDPEGEARRAFGVGKTLGLLPGRVTFVVGRDGRVIDRFSSQLRVKEHVARARRLVLDGPGVTPSP